MPYFLKVSVAPAVTAVTKSDEVCQSSAAVYLPSLSLAISASERVSAEEGVAFSPFGPTVSPALASPVEARSADSASVARVFFILIFVVMACSLWCGRFGRSVQRPPTRPKPARKAANATMPSR